MDEDKNLIDHALIKEFNVHHAKAMTPRINQQMVYLVDEFAYYLDHYQVTNVSWEMVPGKAMSSKTMVDSALAVLKVLTFQRKLPYHEYSAVNWHNQMFKEPRIEKSDVKAWVLEKYPVISPKLSFDVFDAVAITYLSTEETDWQTP